MSLDKTVSVSLDGVQPIPPNPINKQRRGMVFIFDHRFLYLHFPKIFKKLARTFLSPC